MFGSVEINVSTCFFIGSLNVVSHFRVETVWKIHRNICSSNYLSFWGPSPPAAFVDQNRGERLFWRCLRWRSWHVYNVPWCFGAPSHAGHCWPDETFRSSSCAGVTNENPIMRIYITIILLQIRQISAMAGVTCHEEVFQCPARWMSSTTE